jgi:N12 class adenine-specific DNA methylase
MLGRWSGWGALSAVFDDYPANPAEWRRRFGAARDELTSLLSEQEWRAARRTTVNAHYTDLGYVSAIWDALVALGFDEGRVLEPGSGSGTFIGLAPPGAQVVGVEWDPTTAAIAQALYPHATVLNESFADSRLAEGSFDAAVGNVPFGDVVLTDPRHNPSRLSIHNHFIVKSLHLVRPGGMVALLTSRYTMDARNPAARREISRHADLLGAIRLPAGAHRRAAGTDVVTDLLVLRRRGPGKPPDGAVWEQTQPIQLDGEVEVNEYFVDRPDRVLGTHTLAHGQFGDELTVVGDPNADAALRLALDELVTEAWSAGLVMSVRSTDAMHPRPVAVVARAQLPDDFLEAHADGSFTRVERGTQVVYDPPAAQAAELRELIQLRDTAVALLEAESASVDDTVEIVALRADLNGCYEVYSARFGPINRFGERPGRRVDPDTGETAVVRVFPPQGGFRDDPYAAVVYGLEHLDPVRMVATKAELFHHRVVAPHVPRLGADTPADALAICLDAHGEVRVDEVARLLGVDEVSARAGLGELVFDEPGTGRLVPAAEYLSGHVRDKLDIAQTAADADRRFAPNVAALARVLPADLGPGEIEARLGAAWIDAADVHDFLAEILEDPRIAVSRVTGSAWEVTSDRGASVLATTRWGTRHCPAPDVAAHLLEQRPIRLTEEGPDGKRVFSAARTLAAQEKSREMAERFADWVWEDPDRSKRLVAHYNRTFNSLVLRSYDGAHLSLPGLAVTFQPRDHQRAAVARIIAEPAVGLWHEVGAGKTAAMAIAAMELRRLGLAAKPAIVVPNHMLRQFSTEFLQLYPRAKLLAASTEDLTATKRRRFVGKVTTGDWDAVIITRGAFERIPLSPSAQERYLAREVDLLEQAMVRANEGSDRLAVKRLEKMRLRAEERIKTSLSSAKDPGITFELTGIDYLFVDEAHGFKNLRTASNIPAMNVEGSQRATDLHMKIDYLRGRKPRVVTFATATPIANTMGEAYTMLRFLRPDLLESTGVTDFDVFAATFGETVSSIEVAPEGGVRFNTRFARFINVPELLRPWHVAADVKTAQDLNLAVPQLAIRAGDGQRLPETVIVAPSEELRDFVDLLAERAAAVRSRAVDPTEDNMLRITGEGRAAALDLRLVGRTTDATTKIDIAARTIAGIWSDHQDTSYLGMGGVVHERPGALQIVFADLGTPTGRGFDVYTALRDGLVEQGVPRDQVRFIHEADNDRQKQDLFDACRDGRVAVLVGSTEKMGVGTNVQTRAVALHHLDCPWRPADLQQREGRLVRQGNQNPQVRILRYVTEGSFDGYLWQTVTRKATFIAQVMRGRLDVREIDDIGDSALSYNEVKALAAGNPLLLDHAQAQAELTRLERLQTNHHRSRDALAVTIGTAESTMAAMRSRAAAADAAIARRVESRGDRFTMVLNGQTYTDRAQAATVFRAILVEFMGDPQIERGTSRTVGALAGFDVRSTLHRDLNRHTTAQLELVDVPLSGMTFSAAEVNQQDLIGRLTNRVTGLEAVKDKALTQLDAAAHDRDTAQAQLNAPFRYAAALATARQTFEDLDHQLNAQAAPAVPPADPEPNRPGPVAPQLASTSDARRAFGAARGSNSPWSGEVTPSASSPHTNGRSR